MSLTSAWNQVMFRATRGVDIKGDIAIDEIDIRQGACQGTIHLGPLFENKSESCLDTRAMATGRKTSFMCIFPFVHAKLFSCMFNMRIWTEITHLTMYFVFSIQKWTERDTRPSQNGNGIVLVGCKVKGKPCHTNWIPRLAFRWPTKMIHCCYMYLTMPHIWNQECWQKQHLVCGTMCWAHRVMMGLNIIECIRVFLSNRKHTQSKTGTSGRYKLLALLPSQSISFPLSFVSFAKHSAQWWKLEGVL